jgi:hopanoid biosynthesis associated RND transporter like protein HpnN
MRDQHALGRDRGCFQHMDHSWAAEIVRFCIRWRWRVIGVAAVLSVASTLYALTNFKVNTDTEGLLGRELPWERAHFAYQDAFPEHQLIAVVDAPTSELAEIAATRLTAALRRRPDTFDAIREPRGGAFGERSALLHLPADELGKALGGLRHAAPIFAILAADPSLRGAMHALIAGAGAIQAGRLPADGLVRPANALSDMLDAQFDGRYASFSWRALMEDDPGAGSSATSARQMIAIDPKLDFKAMQPGGVATDAIGSAARDVQFAERYGASLHLTGRAALNDAQFTTLSAGALSQLIGTVVTVLAILVVALRSARIIAAVFAALAAAFAMTAAIGLLQVGAFNLISIAFAILFVGLGADFGIQYAVRYRAERHEIGEISAALSSAARKAGGPLALAAAAVTLGFLCFLPTDYRGIAELGEIAGTGMLIAFATTMTLLPALLTVLRPGAEKRPMGLRFLAPADRFLARRRYWVVGGTIVAVLAGLPLLPHIRFDFDPIHLQDQHTEAVTTYRQLVSLPELGVDAANLVVPSIDRLPDESVKLQQVPEVAGTRTVRDLVPPEQQKKLGQIRATAMALRGTLYPAATAPAQSDAERVAAIREAVEALEAIAPAAQGAAAVAAHQLIPLLYRLAAAAPAERIAAEQALVLPLQRDLDRLRNMLAPEPVSLKSLPPAIAREWIVPDGRARIEILPKANPSDSDAMRRFAKAVLTAAPDAAGSSIQLYQSERTVIRAFIEAGVLAIAAIAVILWVALRRIGDVLLTLVPLLVAGLVTLEFMVLFGLSLNFANVIALPLLFGVGVAFKIYYIMAWRSGRTNLLQSTLTRAVFFSALTTATAFGSLWLSRQPGLSSMGELMVLALVCTIAAAVLFQPALMGPPRRRGSQLPLALPPPGAPAPTRRKAPARVE